MSAAVVDAEIDARAKYWRTLTRGCLGQEHIGRYPRTIGEAFRPAEPAKLIQDDKTAID